MEQTQTYFVEGPITTQHITNAVEQQSLLHEAGGVALFVGQVRNDTIDGKKVKAIEYSAYTEMAGKELKLIIDEIISKYVDIKQLSILHSIGVVGCGEASLLVTTAAGHRKTAFDACAETVDLIKDRVPIWKKEIFEDETYFWKE